jgi:hypothetical protein
MKFIIRIFILILVGGVYVANAADKIALPKFSEYPSEIYHGQMKIPHYDKKSDEGWRDDMGKLVAPVEINFAGKYYIGLHSCGGGCRYYTLSDLSTGFDSNALDMFSNADGRPQRISDGREYISSLASHADSKMLVAQYHIAQSSISTGECRERIFVLSADGKSIKPVTGTLKFCEQSE